MQILYLTISCDLTLVPSYRYIIINDVSYGITLVLDIIVADSRHLYT